MIAQSKTYNVTQWREKGFAPKRGEQPDGYRNHGQGRVSHLYREDQVRPVRKYKRSAGSAPPMTFENVLAACWSVNRSAKRYRNAARSCFEGDAYQFATANRHRKQECYRLKDRGIRWLYDQRVLQVESFHAGFCLYTGGGYSFHSTCAPDGIEPDDRESETWETAAKPREKGEMRLVDAKALLKILPSVTEGFYALPMQKKST